MSVDERRSALEELLAEARECVRCPLHASRTQVVPGGGAVDVPLMVVADGPGPAEDARGVPLTGRPAALLDELLAEVGLGPGQVFLTTAVQCRTPQNREPTPGEADTCRAWLEAQVALVRPVVVATLGGLATKLLRGDPAPITRVHGRAEVRTVGGVGVRLLPLLHPAAALYTPSQMGVLREDVARIPALLALGAPERLDAGVPADPAPAAVVEDAADAPLQLGLF